MRTTFVLAATVSVISVQEAFAGGITMTFAEAPGQQVTTLTGCNVLDFNSVTAGKSASYTWTGVGTYSQLNVIAADQYGGAGGNGRYAVTGLSGGYTTTTLTLNSPSAYFGIWWSAGDSANVLSFYDGNNVLVAQFTTASLPGRLPQTYYGNPTPTFSGQNANEPYAFLNFYGLDGTTWSKIVFSNSSSSGFETDNHTTRTTAVTGPLPGYVVSTVSGSNTYVAAAATKFDSSTQSFGNVRTGTAFTAKTLSLQNTATTGTNIYAAKLDASVVAGSGASVAGSVPVSLLAAGQTNSTSLKINLADTATAGAKTGSVTLNLQSHGDGDSALMGTTALPSQTISLSGNVYDYAKPTHVSSVDFGNVRPSATKTVAVTNPGLANYQDSLSISSSGITTPANVSFTRFTSTIAVNGTSQNLTLTASAAGPITGSVGFNVTSTPISGTGLDTKTIADSIAVTGAAYRYASGTLDTTAVNYGYVHAGTTGDALTKGVFVTNTATNDGYSDALGAKLSGTSPAGTSYSGNGTTTGVDLTGATGSQAGNVTLDASTPRVIAGNINGQLWSNPTATGLTGQNVGSSTAISINATVYSGQSTWTASTGGTWGTHGSWTDNQAPTVKAAPGTDAGFLTSDTATFGTAIGSTPATITLAAGTNASVRSLTFNNASAGYTLAGTALTLAAPSSQDATLSVLAGSHTISAPLVLGSSLSLSVAGSSNTLTLGDISSSVSGTSLTKSGDGTLVLLGNAGYSGLTLVTGGTLDVRGSVAGDVTVTTGGMLLRNGTIGGKVTIDGGGFSPGIGGTVGEMNITDTGTSVWGSAGTFHWDVSSISQSSDQDSGKGEDYDFVQTAGALDITATADHPFVLDLSSLGSSGESGPLSGWDPSRSNRWTLLTAAGGINGFDPNKFDIQTSGFFGTGLNAEGSGIFSLTASGDSLYLVYSVPEPATFAVMTIAGMAGASLLRRRNHGQSRR